MLLHSISVQSPRQSLKQSLRLSFTLPLLRVPANRVISIVFRCKLNLSPFPNLQLRTSLINSTIKKRRESRKDRKKEKTKFNPIHRLIDFYTYLTIATLDFTHFGYNKSYWIYLYLPKAKYLLYLGSSLGSPGGNQFHSLSTATGAKDRNVIRPSIYNYYLSTSYLKANTGLISNPSSTSSSLSSSFYRLSFT